MSRLLIGLGNRLRGDDAAGPEVARLVAERDPEARVVQHEREPSDLLDLWQDAEEVVVVDAVEGANPGRIHTFDPAAGPLPDAFATSASTHVFGLPEVVELGRELGRLPADLTLIGIEGSDFALGAPLGPAVRDAVEQVARRLAGEP